MGEAGVIYAEVSDARAAQGGEVGARAEGSGEVVYEGSNVGAAAAGYQELRRLPCRVEGGEFEGMYRDGTCFAFDADAAPVQIVEPYASTLESRGHRRNLEEVTRKGGERVADGVLCGEWGVQVGDKAFRVERIRDGPEAGGCRVGLVEVGNVAGETCRASEEEHEEARGQGVEGSGVPDLGLPGEQAFDPGDRPGTRYARRLVQKKAA